MTLEELERKIESGLTKWPDGATALCPLNGEQYEHYVLAYVPKLGMTDTDVILVMLESVTALKQLLGAKYISWRKHFEWVDDTFRPADVVMDAAGAALVNDPRARAMGGYRSGVVVLNMRRRRLRARILITAKAESADWPMDDAGALTGD